jgi:putative endonuclease
MRRRQYYVYIMTNKINTVLYTGVTSNLLRRIAQHKGGSRQKKIDLVNGFNPEWKDLYDAILG